MVQRAQRRRSVPVERRPIISISLWQILISLLNRYEGSEVCRQEILEKLRGMNSVGYRNIHTIDTYRNYLCKAGFLSTNGRGRYTVEQTIPIDLSIEEAIAYGQIRLIDIFRFIEECPNDLFSQSSSSSSSSKKKCDTEFLSEEEFKI